MHIFIKVKALAKKRPLINKLSFYLPFEQEEASLTTNELIKTIVSINVEAFNKKAVEQAVFPYLTEEDIENLTTTGKIGFGNKVNDKIQDKEQAIENALQYYKDGIFRLFINDIEYEYNEEINLKENDEITFIRLTMLAGRLW